MRGRTWAWMWCGGARTRGGVEVPPGLFYGLSEAERFFGYFVIRVYEEMENAPFCYPEGL
ncbi:MAG: hypothetical protein ACREP6_15370 [Candidatus Binataceae bacterium]